MTTPDFHARVRDVFDAVRRLPAEEQPAALDERCGTDAALRAEVDSLLAAAREPASFLDTPALGADFAVGERDTTRLAAACAPAPTLDRVDGYTILGVLGAGGMATVYRARQDDLGREIALKLMRADAISESLARRFRYEAELLARLKHAGIARIFDVGVAALPDGPRPYFAMELVEGDGLLDYARRRALSIDDRVDLLVKICAAVHYAHQQGIIHRDLKPANIVVDEQGEPRVLDFGVARAVDLDRRATMVETATGELVGTVAYMSPEQTSGDPAAVDTRSDVYALGVLAYELLAGSLPYQVERGIHYDVIRAIREDPPIPLSRAAPSVPNELDTIIARALAKEKDRRFQSAAELEAELVRYRRNEPILSRAPSAVYQLRKFAQRNRVLVGGAAAVVLVLVLGLAATLTFALREAAQHRLVVKREEDLRARLDHLETVTEFQLSMLGKTEPAWLGTTFTASLRGELERMLAADGLSTEERGERLASFDEMVGTVNTTDVGVRVLRAQLEETLHAIDEQFASDPRARARLLAAIAMIYARYRDYDRALALSKEAFDLRRQVLGPNHRETLWSMTAVGVMHERLEEVDEAERWYRGSLALQREALGPGHRDTLTTMSNLGGLLLKADRLAEAEPLLTEAVEGHRRVAGPDPRHLLYAMNYLAELHSKAGRHEQAIEVSREAYRTSVEKLGPDELTTLVNLHGLAARLHRAGRPEARERAQQALAATRRVLGEDHRLTQDCRDLIRRIDGE